MPSDERERLRAFNHVLGNTAAAMLGTAFIWFGITFWAYLATRSVLVTSFLGGAYMLGMAVLGVPFGSLVDRVRKHTAMLVSAVATAAAFLLASAVFVLTPREVLVDFARHWFWLFTGLVLLGAMLAMIRALALSTCVTILVASERRANANGLVGAVNGMTMLVVGVMSGLAIGRLGIGWTLAIAVVVVLLSLLHLCLIRIPEPQIMHAEGVPSPVDFRGAWNAIVAVPGLIGLIIFSTFNNFLGGVFAGLLDPYALELVSVEAWGIIFGLCSVAFIIGGAFVAKFGLGQKPLRSLLLGCLFMWLISGLFAIRDQVWLLALGVFAYMAIIPVVEAAEQTMLQRVVPLPKQGRVFGFAQAVEVSAAPLMAFVVGPVAEFWLIPHAESPAGQQTWSWLLGTGQARGIALVFVLAALVGIVVTLLAFWSRSYRILGAAYAAGDVNADVAATPEGDRPLAQGQGYGEA